MSISDSFGGLKKRLKRSTCMEEVRSSTAGSTQCAFMWERSLAITRVLWERRSRRRHTWDPGGDVGCSVCGYRDFLSNRQYICCTTSFFPFLHASPSPWLEVPGEGQNGQTCQCILSFRAWRPPRRVNRSHPRSTPCSWDTFPVKNPGCGRNFSFSFWLRVETNNHLCPEGHSTQDWGPAQQKDPESKVHFKMLLPRNLFLIIISSSNII